VHWGTCPSTSKSESQLSKYCVVCEISWCRCQQLAALSISTALITKLLFIEQLLHPALKSTVNAPWHNFNLCPSSQQILATPLSKITQNQSKAELTNYIQACSELREWLNNLTPYNAPENCTQNGSNQVTCIQTLLDTHRQHIDNYNHFSKHRQIHYEMYQLS